MPGLEAVHTLVREPETMRSVLHPGINAAMAARP